MSAKVYSMNSLEEAKKEIKENETNINLIFFFWNFKSDDPFDLEDIYGKGTSNLNKTVFLVKSSINFKPPPNGRFIYTPLKRSELKRHTNQLLVSEGHAQQNKHTSLEEKRIFLEISYW